MGDVVLNRASEVSPPRSGGTQQISATTTVATTPFNAAFASKWVSIYVISGTVYVLIGPSTVTVDATASSGATLGKYLAAGEERQYKLEATDTHIACDCPSSPGTAVVEIALSGK